MTDREALLRAIAANPDDDTPRLIYADCVEETGRPEDVARARFIRLQIEEARTPAQSWFAHSDRLTELCWLVGQFAVRWLKELPAWAAKELHTQRLSVSDFSRGFLESARVAAPTFTRHGNELLDVAPIRAVEVRGAAKMDFLPLFDQLHLTRLRSLKLSCPRLPTRVATRLRYTDLLGGLLELDLTGCHLTDAAARWLADARNLRQLRVLRLGRNRIFTEGVVALATSPNLPNLKEIDLRGCALVSIWGNRLRQRFPDKRILI